MRVQYWPAMFCIVLKIPYLCYMLKNGLNRLAAILCFLVVSWSLEAQTDKEFWFAAPDLTTAHCDQPIDIRLVTLSEPALVTLSQPANPAFIPMQLFLPANSSGVLSLTLWKSMVESAPANTVLNTGLHLVSSGPLHAMYEVACDNTEIFPLKGKNALGYQFVVPIQNYFANGSSLTPPPLSSFIVLATEDNTTVTIIPSQDIQGHLSGIPFTVTLNKGQVYTALATGDAATAHLGGSQVSSDKKIVITTADDSVVTPWGTCLDLLGDQVVPETRIGSEYALVKGLLPLDRDRVFVFGTMDNTGIYVDGNPVPVSFVNRGEIYSFNLTNPVTYLKTDHPVYVTHITGTGCELADALVPPLYCSGYHEFAYYHPSASSCYGFVMVKSGAEDAFTVNGNPGVITPSQFISVPGTSGAWLAARVDLTSVTGSSIRVWNGESTFIMGILHAVTGGSTYGYFTDFGPMRVDLGEDTIICDANELELDAGNPGCSYVWQDGSTLQEFTVTTPGSFSVTVTDSDGCYNIDTVAVAFFPGGTVVWGNPPPDMCVDGSPVLLQPGSPPGGIFLGTGVVGNVFYPTLSGAGTFSLSYVNMDENGCTNKDEHEIVVHDLPMVIWVSFPPDVCINSSPVVLSGTIPAGGTYSGPGVTNGIFDPVQAGLGTHFITYTFEDAFGCVNNTVIALSVYDLPIVTFPVTFPPMCLDASPLTLSGAMPMGGTYSGNGVTSNKFYPSLAGPGIHVITYIFQDGNQCVNSVTRTIEVYDLPVAAAAVLQAEVCTGQTIQLNGSASGGSGTGYHYQWSGPSGFNSIQPNPSLMATSAIQSGNYNLQVYDSHGCYSPVSSVSVTIHTRPTALAAVLQSPLCQGQTMNLNGTAGAGSPPYTYSWTGPQTFSSSLEDPIISNAQPSHSGFYNLVVSDFYGCASTGIASVMVVVYPLPVATVTVAQNQVCQGSAVVLQGSASGGSSSGYLFQWNGTGGYTSSLQSPVITAGLPPTTQCYELLVTDGNSCTSSMDSVCITVHTVPAPVASSNSPVCQGSSLQLACNSTASGNFSWTGPNGFTSSQKDPSLSNVTLLAAGTYTVTETNAFNCQGTSSTVVTVNPRPVVNAGPDQNINYGVYTTLSGTVSNCGASCNLAWQPSALLSSANNILNPVTVNLTATQTYTLQAVNALSGCSSVIDTVIINVSGTALSVNPTATLSTICQGSSSQLQAGASGGNLSYTYSWSPASGLNNTTIANPLATPAATTTYSVTASDGYHQVSEQVTVTVVPAPVCQAGNDTVVCYGASLSLSSASASGVISLQWQTLGDGSFSNASQLNPSYSPGQQDLNNASVTLILNVTGQADCGQTRDTIVVSYLGQTIAYAGENDTVCAGTTFSPSQAWVLNASSVTWATSGDGTLSDPNTLNPVYTPGFQDTASGTVILSLHAHSLANYCEDSISSLTLTIKPLPSTNAGPDAAVCLGDSVQIHASGGQNFQWSPSTGLSGSLSADPWARPSATTLYVVVSELDGCYNSDTVEVMVRSLPQLQLSPDTNICPGDSVYIWVSGAETYLWSNGCTNSGQWVIPPTSMAYLVTGTDTYGCQNVAETKVYYYQQPSLSANPAFLDLCEGEAEMIWISGAIAYHWYPATGLSNPHSAVVLVSPLTSQLYTVEGVNEFGCQSSIQVPVGVYPTPLLTLPDTSFLCDNQTLMLNAGWNEDVSYQWQDGTWGQYYYVTAPGTYSVTAENPGCEVVDTIWILPCAKVFVPNAFTPDENGLNDRFMAQSSFPLEEFSIYIFSRLGNLVFESHSITDGWDGKIKGNYALPGVYTWVIYYTSFDAGPQRLKGTVTLMR